MNRFERFLAHLREKAPTKRRVVVRRVCGMRDDGTTSMSDRGLITVTINRDNPIHIQLDTLVHEWGHVYEYDKLGNHGRYFGAGYSKAYEAWEDFTANE
jgi:hypothetical protein